MKNAKNVLLATLLLSSLQSNTENLSGRTRNLNIIQLHPHMYVQLSAGEHDSQNILRDLARNCNNPNFEMTIAFKVKPFATRADIKNLLESSFVQPIFLQVCKKLAPEQNLNDLDALLRHPEIGHLALQFYAKYTADYMQQNMENAFDDQLKELLLSKDSQGKSALDIVNAQPDEFESMMLKKVYNQMKEVIDAQAAAEKQHEIHEEINKNQQ